jgi:hypothetical protein
MYRTKKELCCRTIAGLLGKSIFVLYGGVRTKAHTGEANILNNNL